MRVLIEHGSYSLTNLGDLAMLRVCVERVRQFSPEAEIFVPSSLAADVGNFIPGVSAIEIPLSAHESKLAESLSRLQSRPIASAVLAVLMRLRARVGWPLSTALDGLSEPPDLVIHAGSGLFADPYAAAALRRTQVLATAQDLAIPTAMFSQGIGPLTSWSLRHELSRIVPRLKLIGSREKTFTPSLLSELEAADDRIHVTGDDSLELAFQGRSQRLGTRLGLNTRLAAFTESGEIPTDGLLDLTDAMSLFTSKHRSEIALLSLHTDDNLETPDPFRKRMQYSSQHSFTIESLLQSLSTCRVVLSSSYHGAVLALGQGIPAVCFYKTEYYRRKFVGLAGMFPDGCTLIDLNGDLNEQDLLAHIEGAWQRAAELRPALLESTSKQIQDSCRAYGLLLSGRT